MVAVGLSIRNVVVEFGGLTAVDYVSIDAPGATITGLVGPNGAGKSTTLNTAAGTQVPTSGSVSLGDTVLDGLPPHKRAQLGLGRTFQRMELFDTMTVYENVALGREGILAGRRPWLQLAGTRQDAADIAERTAHAMELCNITELAARTVADLSTGQRRLVEFARAIATGSRFLLLDEPSSGLDVDETERFGAALEKVIERDQTGILLVEHDMALVRAACRYIYVLDFGTLLIHGPAEEVLDSDVVRAAYLGEAEEDTE